MKTTAQVMLLLFVGLSLLVTLMAADSRETLAGFAFLTAGLCLIALFIGSKPHEK